MKYKKIALVGMMGSGKTTVAKLLAEKLNLEFIDSDEVFEMQYGKIKEYFKFFGEESFRQKETAILYQTILKKNFVLSCGGGIILSKENRDVLFKGDICTIYLQTDENEIYNRIKDNNSRPLLEQDNTPEKIKHILSKREEFYKQANITIKTDNKTPYDVVQEIILKLKENINIKLQENKISQIIIERGITDNFENFFEEKKYFLITNTTLKKLYPNFVSKFDSDRVIVIKDGEKYKNYQTVNYILEQLLSKNIERKDCIVAFGGGVVGDLAGYAASIILRGVELIQIPTTLLAMCDSSIGGKTGYNSQYGKNLIGSFYLASKVIIDTNFLKTLNDYEFKCGLGEVIKYALIEKSCKAKKKYNLLDYFTTDDIDTVKENIDKIVEICINLKANVVNLDMKERNLRKVLNFGHTFAHPIETISKYKNISHGQAVAYGIKYASRLAYTSGKIDKSYYTSINFLLEKFGLISTKIKFEPKKIINLMQKDKKVQNGKINLLIPVGIGSVELFDNIDLPSLEACLL